MSFGKLYLWFYCMEIEDAVLLLLVCSAIFCRMRENLENRHWWRGVLACLLAILVATVWYTTIGNRGESGDATLHLVPFHSYREVWAGGNPEIYRSNFMNAALFYPGGLLLISLLPKKWYGWCKCILVAVLFMAMSIGIEYVQYRYGLGNCEIDDVIHNAIGALLGGIATMALPPILNWFLENGNAAES